MRRTDPGLFWTIVVVGVVILAWLILYIVVGG